MVDNGIISKLMQIIFFKKGEIINLVFLNIDNKYRLKEYILINNGEIYLHFYH